VTGGYRFESWSLDPATGELRNGADCVRLQEQPLRLLVALLERPHELVSKEDLCARLWPDGTRVDYEHGIGNAVHKLREALDDSAAQPRFIETVPRRGYRFLVAVENGRPAACDDGGVSAAAARPTIAKRAAAVAGAVLAAAGIWVALAYRAGSHTEGSLSTHDAAARETYLRGEHLLARKTADDIRRSAVHFRSAIERDPGFAEAWASLAYAYHFLGALGVLAPEEAYQRSSEAAYAALGLDREHARASAILAETTFRFGPGADAAEEWFLRALRLDPASAETRHWYGNYLAATGEGARALAELERAYRLDPLDLHVNVDLAAHLYENGRREEARDRLRATLELDPRYPKTHYLAGWIALREGREEEAMAEFRRTVELAPGVPKFVQTLQDLESRLETTSAATPPSS
jgi:DNA-binding winged helix-turn-helix (wHTH) protein/Tfp pilus assembly protein PilF